MWAGDQHAPAQEKAARIERRARDGCEEGGGSARAEKIASTGGRARQVGNVAEAAAGGLGEALGPPRAAGVELGFTMSSIVGLLAKPRRPVVPTTSSLGSLTDTELTTSTLNELSDSAETSLSYNMSHIIAAVGGAALAYGAKILYASAQKSSSSGTPILYYWPARGRGEQIRLIFAEAGVDFVDDTFDMTSAEAREAFFARCRTLGKNLTTNIPMVFSATSGIPTHTTPEKHPA